MYLSEVNDIGAANMDENFFNIGILITDGSGEVPIEFPPTIGRFVAKIIGPTGKDVAETTTELVPCKDVMNNLN